MKFPQSFIKLAILAIVPLLASLGVAIETQSPVVNTAANSHVQSNVQSNSQLTASSCSLPGETPPKTTQTDENV